MSINSLGDDAPDGWVLEQYEEPLAKGRSGIVRQVDEILGHQKVQSITIELGRPLVYTRFVKAEEALGSNVPQPEGMTVGEAARNVTMEELVLEGNSFSLFTQIIFSLAVRRMHVTHIGIGVASEMFNWLDIDPISYGGIESVCGAKLERDREIPNDVIIFFSGHRCGGRLDEATLAVKCLMVENDDEQ